MKRHLILQFAVTLAAAVFAPHASAAPATISVRADQPGHAISPLLWGIFFEDLSYAADGGLYAELIQNRSFDYSAADHVGWTPLTAWQLVQPQPSTMTVAPTFDYEAPANSLTVIRLLPPQ